LSRRSRAKRVAWVQAGAFVFAAIGSTGCWEQWSDSWWPQMKWQKAVQAYELQGRPGDAERPVGNFVPPEGTVPVGMPYRIADLTPQEGEALPNPNPPTLASLENGKVQYNVFCAPCHGAGGLGDGPVAGPPYGKGPFVGVLPVAGPVGKALVGPRTDGHIYTVIGQGIRRMPNYKRIPSSDRWDIVNYVRYLNGQVPGPQPAQTASAAPAAPAAPAVSAAPAAGDGSADPSGGAN
jgi:mono/diheme cytochrome c family protein